MLFMVQQKKMPYSLPAKDMVGSLRVKTHYGEFVSTTQNKINPIKEPNCCLTHVPV